MPSIRFLRKLVGPLLFAIVFWIVFLLYFGIIPAWQKEKALAQSKQEVPTKLQLWTDAKITHYQIKVWTMTLWGLKEFEYPDEIYYCGMLGWVTLTIKDGEVINAPELDQCKLTFPQLTVEKTFALAEKYSVLDSPRVELLSFDLQYGYITEIGLRYPSSGHPILLRYSDLVILDR